MGFSTAHVRTLLATTSILLSFRIRTILAVSSSTLTPGDSFSLAIATADLVASRSLSMLTIHTEWTPSSNSWRSHTFALSFSVRSTTGMRPSGVPLRMSSANSRVFWNTNFQRWNFSFL